LTPSDLLTGLERFERDVYLSAFVVYILDIGIRCLWILVKLLEIPSLVAARSMFLRSSPTVLSIRMRSASRIVVSPSETGCS